MSDVQSDNVAFDIQAVVDSKLTVIINNASIEGDGRGVSATSVSDFKKSNGCELLLSTKGYSSCAAING